MFERYDIISQTDLADAARKIEAGARNSQLTHSEPESPSNGETQSAKDYTISKLATVREWRNWQTRKT